MNLIEGLQSEMNRVRNEVLPEYEKIPAGMFAAALMKDLIRRTERAIANGDTIAMLGLHEELKNTTL